MLARQLRFQGVSGRDCRGAVARSGGPAPRRPRAVAHRRRTAAAAPAGRQAGGEYSWRSFPSLSLNGAMRPQG